MKKLSIETFIDNNSVGETLIKYEYLENKRYDILAKGIERVIQELQFKKILNDKIRVKCGIVETDISN